MQHALRNNTQHQAYPNGQTEEEARLQHLEVIEEPCPKNPDLYSDKVDEEGGWITRSGG